MPKKHLKPRFEEIDSEEDESCREIIIHEGLQQKESVFELDLKPILERHKEELRLLTSTYKMENDYLKRENQELQMEIGRLRGINVEIRQKDDVTIKNLRKVIDFGSDKLLRDKDRLMGQLRQELSNAKRDNDMEVRALKKEIQLYRNQLLFYKDQIVNDRVTQAHLNRSIQELKVQVSNRDICIQNLKAEVSSKRNCSIQNLGKVSSKRHFSIQNLEEVMKNNFNIELAKVMPLVYQEVEKLQTTVESYKNEAQALRKRNQVVEHELALKTQSLKEIKRNRDRILFRLQMEKNQIKKQSQKSYCHKRVALPTFLGPKNINRTYPVRENRIKEPTSLIQDLGPKSLKFQKEREKDNNQRGVIKNPVVISQDTQSGTSRVPSAEITSSKSRRKNRGKFPQLEIIKGETPSTAKVFRPFSVGGESKDEKPSFSKLQKRKNI